MADDAPSHEHHRLHDAAHGHGATMAMAERATAELSAKVTDPVCGMSVSPATSKHHFDHDGHIFHFCSAQCREKFAAGPAGYLEPIAKPESPDADGTVYTCPMHPEIRQDGPGSCPICGMALEPLAVTAEAPPNHELTDMTRRFRIALVLSSPVVVVEMGAHVPWLDLPHIVPAAVSIWIQFAFTTPVVLWAGMPVSYTHLRAHET